jgi:hypothetical protein
LSSTKNTRGAAHGLDGFISDLARVTRADANQQKLLHAPALRELAAIVRRPPVFGKGP